jgi:hypothetical protein
MLDFASVRNKEKTVAELVTGLGPAELADLTNEMIDTMLEIIAGCTDADVTFVPEDPTAFDSAAATEGELHLPWTLGHVIVHVTASSEESAFLAAELARGVPYTIRRSRSEVPWPTITTVDQCRRRLEESRRMRLASLAMWPDPPHLDNVYLSPRTGRPINAVERFAYGLSHDDAHLAQMTDVISQARATLPL